MKKLMALALALGLTVCLAGCGADKTLTAENQALTKQNHTLTAENKKLTAENKKLKTASGSAETSTGNVENDSPIDAAFQPKLDKAQTTYDINTVAGGWRDAWKTELTAFVRDMEKETKDPQDLADLETYLKNAEKQADVLEQAVYMVGAGAETPRADRPASAGTGASASVALSAEKVYRDAFFALYGVRYPGDASWTWRFQGDGTAPSQTVEQDG